MSFLQPSKATEKNEYNGFPHYSDQNYDYYICRGDYMPDLVFVRDKNTKRPKKDAVLNFDLAPDIIKKFSSINFCGFSGVIFGQYSRKGEENLGFFWETPRASATEVLIKVEWVDKTHKTVRKTKKDAASVGALHYVTYTSDISYGQIGRDYWVLPMP